MIGFGATTTDTVKLLPAQPLARGVTVYMTVSEALVVLVSV